MCFTAKRRNPRDIKTKSENRVKRIMVAAPPSEADSFESNRHATFSLAVMELVEPKCLFDTKAWSRNAPGAPI
jgi:hypothetical protein